MKWVASVQTYFHHFVDFCFFFMFPLMQIDFQLRVTLRQKICRSLEKLVTSINFLSASAC